MFVPKGASNRSLIRPTMVLKKTNTESKSKRAKPTSLPEPKPHSLPVEVTVKRVTNIYVEQFALGVASAKSAAKKPNPSKKPL